MALKIARRENSIWVILMQIGSEAKCKYMLHLADYSSGLLFLRPATARQDDGRGKGRGRLDDWRERENGAKIAIRKMAVWAGDGVCTGAYLHNTDRYGRSADSSVVTSPSFANMT